MRTMGREAAIPLTGRSPRASLNRLSSSKPTAAAPAADRPRSSRRRCTARAPPAPPRSYRLTPSWCSQARSSFLRRRPKSPFLFRCDGASAFKLVCQRLDAPLPHHWGSPLPPNPPDPKGVSSARPHDSKGSSRKRRQRSPPAAAMADCLPPWLSQWACPRRRPASTGACSSITCSQVSARRPPRLSCSGRWRRRCGARPCDRGTPGGAACSARRCPGGGRPRRL